MKARGKPVHVARVCNVRVSVYRNGAGRYCVPWRETAHAPRRRETFGTRAAAITRAEEIARALANSLADVVTLTSADRDSYRLAAQALAPLGIPLHAAISEYTAARQKIAPHTLMEAANFFVRGHVERRAIPATAQILAEMLAQLRDDRREEKKYVRRLERDLARFARDFPHLEQAAEEQIRSYLRGLQTSRATRDKETGERIPKGAAVGARRRDNVRDAIVTLMRFARKKEYLPEGKTSPVEHIPHIAEAGEVTTYTPEEVAQILTYLAENDPDWLPWAATQALAGPRTSEILRLQWSAYKWDESAIAISAKIARKVRVSRHAPILPSLAAWLVKWRTATGFVIPRKWKDMEAAHSDALARLRKALGWAVWKTNALRHSFGSHRLAVVKNIAQVADEMGNSPEMVREDYNDSKTEAAGRRYQAIMPPQTWTNVLPFVAAE